ncbi:MAG TPA: hypothetical protein VEB87_07405 [Nitrososphaerales archaeon]|nr:hypothetical protein [Nitrososphaerales archaeon]
MFSAVLANVPLSTANLLAYVMLGLVTLFLLTSLGIAYYFWRQTKKMKAASPTGSA